MNVAKQVEYLSKIKKPCPVRKKVKLFGARFWAITNGWLTIEKTDGSFSIMSSSNKYDHNRSFGSTAYMIYIGKESGELNEVMESAITFHIVSDKERRKNIFALMKHKIRIAYEWQKTLEGKE